MTRSDVQSNPIPFPEHMDVRRYVGQGALWATPNGLVPIAEMTADHKRHAARWMTDNATALILVCESSINEDILTEGGTANLGSVLRLMSMKPREWVETTSLYGALTR